MNAPEHLTHTFPAFIYPAARVLILGSFPSPKSREMGFYYGHPQNRFWKVMAAVLAERVPETIAQKKAMLRAHHIALWDVLASCTITGASDASIKDAVANDIAGAVKETEIRYIFTTGQKAGALYKKYCLEKTGIPALVLPSTSPANCAFSFERLVAAYRVIEEDLRRKV